MKTTTVKFTGKEKIEFVEEEVQDPKETEIVIKTAKTMISTGTELAILAERHTHHLIGRKSWCSYPWRAGYINAGTIVKKGKNVANYREGDRVLSSNCNSIYWKCDQTEIVPIPDKVKDEEALFAIIGGIVLPGVRMADIKIGDSAAVVGLGLLGQICLQMCKINGALPAIGIDLSEFRLDIAKKIGIEKLINSGKTDMIEEVKKLTENRGVDVAIELTGVPKVFPQVCKLPRNEGKVIILSSPHGTVEMDLYTDMHGRGLQVIGLGGGNYASNRWIDFNVKKLCLSLIENKMIKVNELITHRYNWKKADEGYFLLLKDRGNALGVIIDWTK